MASGTVNVHISRSAGDVFAVIADVSKNARWSSSAVEGRQTSPGPVGVGTSAREVSTFLGRRIEVDSVVTEFIAGRRLAYRTTGGPFVAVSARLRSTRSLRRRDRTRRPRTSWR